MTQVFYASRFFGAMTLAAGIDAGVFGPASRERVLIVSGNDPIPEIALPLHETPGYAALRERFSRVLVWNDVIAPLHPADWKPRAIETPLLSRMFHETLGLPHIEELILESIVVPPARVLAGLFKDYPITVYSDGLMAHSPTRDPLPREIIGRVERLLHLDLVPGVDPLLLTEYDVPSQPLPPGTFADVVGRVAVACGPQPEGEAVILGQYLSALGILTPDDEFRLHADMVKAVVARGHRTIVFKPHPACGKHQGRELTRLATGLGATLVTAPEDVPAEVLFATRRVSLVVSCFSTGLMTARRFFGLPVATVGTQLLLERLAPYENSNRVPVTIVDATVPRLEADGSLTDPIVSDVKGLVDAVAYCMQSAAHPELRDAAQAYVKAHGPVRYFKKKRLEVLGLIEKPASPPPPPPKTGLARLKQIVKG
ncbi:polysialyltransferase family glycosyltransferase [Herbidospora mongoliensis]|uniref:polysialyltransferase family glycosyltransferase n=1 Tax=Herbidospora mongoliensis TaxID=688067 RepID=UPI000835BC9A|nr:polysialyltransferase family glycosyltransferase [Herbidospora mongoliensis]